MSHDHSQAATLHFVLTCFGLLYFVQSSVFLFARHVTASSSQLQK